MVRSASIVAVLAALIFLSGREVKAQVSAAPPPSLTDVKSYHMVKVAEGVFAFIAPDGITPMVNGNSLAVIGDDGVLVVDTGQLPSIAKWEIAQIRALTRQPIRYIVNTHWHPDHWVGNQTFQAAFPGVVIVSTPSTREAMMTQAPQFIDPKQLSGNRDAVQKVLAAGKGSDGTPLSENTKLWYGYAVGQIQGFLPELEHARLAFPTQTYQDSITIYLGKREVQVRFLGRANTAGDAVVYVPDARVLATGDLVVHPYPYIFGSFVGEWIEVMRKLQAIDAVAIVPGHGAVENDKSYLSEVTELLESLQSQAQALVKEGVSMDDARRRFDLDRFREQMCPDGSPFCETGFRQSMAAAAGRAWHEAKEGKLRTEQ